MHSSVASETSSLRTLRVIGPVRARARDQAFRCPENQHLPHGGQWADKPINACCNWGSPIEGGDFLHQVWLFDWHLSATLEHRPNIQANFGFIRFLGNRPMPIVREERTNQLFRPGGYGIGLNSSDCVWRNAAMGGTIYRGDSHWTGIAPSLFRKKINLEIRNRSNGPLSTCKSKSTKITVSKQRSCELETFTQ